MTTEQPGNGALARNLVHGASHPTCEKVQPLVAEFAQAFARETTDARGSDLEDLPNRVVLRARPVQVRLGSHDHDVPGPQLPGHLAQHELQPQAHESLKHKIQQQRTTNIR